MPFQEKVHKNNVLVILFQKLLYFQIHILSIVLLYKGVLGTTFYKVLSNKRNVPCIKSQNYQVLSRRRRETHFFSS